MIRNVRLLLVLFFVCISGLVLPGTASAMYCAVNGALVNIVSGVNSISIPVTVSKTMETVMLVDLASIGTCTGKTSSTYQGALLFKEGTALLDPRLTAAGFTGRVQASDGSYSSFPLAGAVCIWPDSACSIINQGSDLTRPIMTNLSMTRDPSKRWPPTSIPAGTVVAQVNVAQRGVFAVGASPTWYGMTTWQFVLANDLVLPAYSCTVDNKNLLVTLPTIGVTDLVRNGAGRYPTPAPFSLSLTCDVDASVSVTFDGSTMQGKNDVLINSTKGNPGVGVQVDMSGNTVSFGDGRIMSVTEHAQSHETVPLNAYYYYDGSGAGGGEITSVATFTFTYN